MENLDQLDALVANNRVLIRYVVVFVISATLIIVVCVLAYSYVTVNMTIDETKIEKKKDVQVIKQQEALLQQKEKVKETAEQIHKRRMEEVRKMLIIQEKAKAK
ncbi:ORF49 [Agrotis segetum granulovirus]|uniref:ORF49 n=1 Tax=Agrotis segetum granulosis virus TaxID=10464 RepID=Q6QXK8_GVAS|nr:hypothetical protein AsGV058 [Agrotis segetum granulovirus]AAS82689.1 ORF49 [Agrotis segetum granulovirus]AHN92097.1 hypothetical protein AsGV058 [Agrotis segetum granulovirus]AKN63332.1 hypothetical protein AsGV058 [Agrotis segetum granulovirus]